MVNNEQAVKGIFLLVFFLIYGGVHFYLFLGARASLALGTRSSTLLALFMFIMVVAPVIVHGADQNGLRSVAHFFAWTGYIWMGFAFLFFCLSLVFDCYRLLVHLAAYLSSLDFSSAISPARLRFITLVGLAAALALYGSFEALQIRAETITIRTAKVPEEVGRFRIVQISDLHLGLIVGEKRLKLMLEKVRAAAPDMLVSTGDLVDGETNNLSDLAVLLREIDPPCGKYAVTGNHEFYAGLDPSVAFTKRAGFTVLRGETVTVGGFMTVAGVDDPTGTIYRNREGKPERELLAEVPRDRFTVLLKHQPTVTASSPAPFDLQLSGHTHKGQIFPFTLLTRLAFPYNSGRYQLSNGAVLYVSRGTGTWGPPMRLLAPPEVTIIDLVRDKG